MMGRIKAVFRETETGPADQPGKMVVGICLARLGRHLEPLNPINHHQHDPVLLTGA
jgi:hypothetical protein